MAGLWDASRADDGSVIQSCTIITMPPNPLLAEIHNAKQRMPAILQSQDIDAWLTGYRREAELSAADEAEIWTFILFRRLLLVAWIGSHRAVDIAQQLGAGYTRDSCHLAETYLSRAG